MMTKKEQRKKIVTPGLTLAQPDWPGAKLTPGTGQLSVARPLDSVGPSGLGVTKKLEMKVLKGTEDDNYSSEEESDDDRKGGWRMLRLLKKVSKPCHRKGETKKMVHCVGSKGK